MILSDNAIVLFGCMENNYLGEDEIINKYNSNSNLREN